MKKISLGYSPCPNDTFIFYALVHNKIKGCLKFSEILRDVETLNRMASLKKLDMTKASFHAYGFLRQDYCLLHSGSAIGRGCGPLIIAKKPIKRLSGKKIAIPGKMTTAYLLLKLFDPGIKNIIEMPFDMIINAVSMDLVDAGLIIHEGRFTYPSYGLEKVIDLGEWWENETGLAIPLGGIFVKRELGKKVVNDIDAHLRKSIEYALSNPAVTSEYIREHAQELDDEVINQHIKLYVNENTLDIGDEINAVEELLRKSEEMNLIPHLDISLFVD